MEKLKRNILRHLRLANQYYQSWNESMRNIELQLQNLEPHEFSKHKLLLDEKRDFLSVQLEREQIHEKLTSVCDVALKLIFIVENEKFSEVEVKTTFLNWTWNIYECTTRNIGFPINSYLERDIKEITSIAYCKFIENIAEDY